MPVLHSLSLIYINASAFIASFICSRSLLPVDLRWQHWTSHAVLCSH